MQQGIEAGLDELPEMSMAGDLLLAFQVSETLPPCRGASLQNSQAPLKDGTGLAVYPTTNGWQGYPLQILRGAGWQLWLVGEIYGHDDPSAILLDVVTNGRNPRVLNGHFLLLARSEETHTWHAWTDRFGTLHAYYASDGERAALGTFFPQVAALASRRQLDWVGLTGFFNFGFFPQDRTFYEDVRILRPASHYVFDADGKLLSQERYWQWSHHPDPTRSYDDTVGVFSEVFRDVMADHLRKGRIAIPISGGLDSRSTVAAVNGQNGFSTPTDRLWAYSYGYSPRSPETRIARQVAKRRGLPFQAFSIQPYLFDSLDLVLSSVEGFQDVTQCRQASIVSELAAHADYVIAAHWGDVWLDDMGLAASDSGELTEERIVEYTLHKMEKRGRQWLLKNLCAGRTGTSAPEDLLHAAVHEGLGVLSHIDDTDFRVKAFKTDNWSFRWTTASLRMFQPGAFPRLPFYDTRLADFFCTVPSAYVAGRRLQIDFLRRWAPDLARVPWQVYDADLFHYQWHSSWLLPKRALKKTWRVLTRPKVTERNWEVQLLGAGGREGVKQWLLQSGLRLHEFVSPAALQTLVESFYDAPLVGNRGYTLSMLLTFSAWLERYG